MARLYGLWGRMGKACRRGLGSKSPQNDVSLSVVRDAGEANVVVR
jgi:hypothetical protein